MTKKINVMAIQMSSVLGDKKQNIEKIKKLINNNAKPETDIIFLPEVWTVGWACEYFPESAETLDDSEVIRTLSELAKTHNVNIVGGSFITKKDGKMFNTCPVINRKGELIATYDKCHLFSYYGDKEGTYITEGSNPVIVDIEGVRAGLTICYDIRFPEIYRAYAYKGVDLMANMAAWGSKKEIPWVSMTHSRAVENQCYFIALTQSGAIEHGEFNLGKSTIINYKGDNLAEITSDEGAIFATLDIDEQNDFREKCTVLKDVHKSYDVKEC